MLVKTGLTLLLPAAVAVAVAGCGSSTKVATGTSDSTTPTSPTTQATVTDTVVPPPSTVTTTGTSTTPTATGPVACATTNLTVDIGSGQGAAGSIVDLLDFTNKGSAACTIAGYPGVSLVAPGNGAQVGPAAVRSTGATVKTVTLSPGATASASVKVADYANFPASSCAASPVSGFRVYPPGNKAAVYVPFTSTYASYPMACTKASELEVQPVVAGAGG